MQAEETVYTTVLFFIVYKVLNMLLSFNGMILKHFRSRNMNIMKELKTVISIGLYRENLLLSWVR